MLQIISKLFGGSKSEKDVKKIDHLVAVINGHFNSYKGLSNDELRAKTTEFKARIKAYLAETDSQIEALQAEAEALPISDFMGRDGLYEQVDLLKKQKDTTLEKVLWDILPEAFAVVREAAKRTLGQRHYDVQLMGGAALHRGNIAEMRTGEGKTLVSTLPAYLNALTGKGVHIVTVNDYLAERDSEWMGRVHRFLGLKVGVILASMSPAERREAYAADITYGCLLYTSPSPRDQRGSRMPSSA